MCDLTNLTPFDTLTPLTNLTPLLSLISSIFGLIILIYKLNIGKDSSDFFSAIHKISIFPSTILPKSPTLFLMELIFRYEKITLLISECRKRFKVTVIFSFYPWLVIDPSIKGLIYLLNMRSTRSYFFQNTFNIFSKNTIFGKSPPNNILFIESRGVWICRH